MWNDFRNNIESITVKTALKNCTFETQPNSIICYFPSERIKDVFIQQKSFASSIQESFTTTNIALESIVDISRFPEFEALMKQRRQLTTKEKFEMMEKKNPLIRDLMETLKLKVES